MNNVLLVAKNIINHAGYMVNLPDGFESIVPGDNPYMPKSEDRFVRVNGVFFEGAVPVIRASAFRSAWRERAVERIMSGKSGGSQIENNSVKPNTMITLTKGGILGKNEDTDLMAPAEAMRHSAVLRKENPLMAAFGGSFPYFMGGSVSVGNLFPNNVFTIGKISTNRGNIRNTLLQSLVADTTASFDRAMAPLNEEKKKALAPIEKSIAVCAKDLKGLKQGTTEHREAEGVLKALREKKKDIEKEFKDKKNQLAAEHGETSTSLLQSVSASDAKYSIPARQSWSQRIRITNASDAEVGLLLDSLASFSGGMMLGGRSNAGDGGDLELDYEVLFYDHDQDNFVIDGTLTKPGKRAKACVQALLEGEFDFINSIPDRVSKSKKTKK